MKKIKKDLDAALVGETNQQRLGKLTLKKGLRNNFYCYLVYKLLLCITLI